MAKREIVVRLGDEETSFGFARVDRGKLYGRKERVVLDENGARCVAAFLTADGAALVPPGGTAHLYVDEAFETVDRKDLVAVGEDGAPLTPTPSTLGVAQPLTEASPARLLDHLVTNVYALSSEALGAALQAALAGGAIFECAYQYRDGYEPDALFVLANDEGVFALVAQPTGFGFLAREAPLDTGEGDEEADDLDDDLDFSMM